MAALSDAQRDYFGVFALNVKLLNAMKTNPKEFIKKAKTRGILKILGFKPRKELTKKKTWKELTKKKNQGKRV